MTRGRVVVAAVIAGCGRAPAASREPEIAVAPLADAAVADAMGSPGCLPHTRLVDVSDGWTFSVPADGQTARVCGGQEDEDDHACMDVDRDGRVTPAPEHVPEPEAPAWPTVALERGAVSYCVAADRCAALKVTGARRVAVEPGTTRVALLTDTTVEVWDGATGKRTASAAATSGEGVEWVAGDVLITSWAGRGRDAELWAVTGKQLARVAQMEQLVLWGAVAPGQLVTIDASTEIVVWDAATGARLRAELVQRYVPDGFDADDPGSVESIAARVYDGGYAVFASGDELARIAFVDVADGAPVLVDAPICADR